MNSIIKIFIFFVFINVLHAKENGELELKGIKLGSVFTNYKYKGITKSNESDKEYLAYIENEKYSIVWVKIENASITSINSNRVTSKSKEMCIKDVKKAINHIINKYYKYYHIDTDSSRSKFADEIVNKDTAILKMGNPQIGKYTFFYSFKPVFFKTQYENHCEISVSLTK